jgi:hypothetical protein
VSVGIPSSGTIQWTSAKKYSLVMSVSGATYQMLNGTTNVVLYQNTISSKVFQMIIGNCSSNYKVYIMPGTYTVSSTWYITKSNLYFNFSTSLLVAGNGLNNPVVYVDFVNNVTIVNAKIDANAANQATHTTINMYVVGNNDLCTNCTLFNSPNFGYDAPYSTNNTGITYSHIYACYCNCIQLNGRYDYAYYDVCQGCADVCISTYGNYTQIKHNICYNSTSAYTGYANSYVGIDIETDYGGSPTNDHNCVVANNIIYDTGTGSKGFGIFMDDSGSVSNIWNCTIANNTITDPDDRDMAGIWITGTSITVKNNTVTGMYGTGTNNAGNGIVITCYKCLITNNIFKNCQNDGVNPYSSTYDTFSQNTFKNDNIGIEVWNCQNMTWLYNTATNNTSYGIDFVSGGSGAVNNFFANNTVSGNGAGDWYGMSTSTNSTFQGNTGLGTGYKTLNVTVSGNGSVSESSGTQTLSSISGDLWQFPTGSTIVLTAIYPSSSFYNFTFSNGTVTTNNPLHLLMNNNFEVTANFAA